MSTDARLEGLRTRWWAAVREELPGALALRRELHAEPRGAGDEEDTAARVAQAMGLDLTTVAQTGRIGRLDAAGGAHSGPAGGAADGAILLRAELDALPMVEETGAAYAATNGWTHACGHDVHLAALAAVVRAARRVELPIALVPVLQPREETYPSGALDILRSGVLEEHGVAAAIAAHVHPGIPVGAVATGAGAVNAAADEFEIVLRGEGGHGGYPHQSSDPVPALGHLLLALPEAVRRTVDPMRPATLSVGHVLAGDDSANVRPALARVFGTMRTTDPRDRAALGARLESLVAQVAALGQVEGSVTITEGEPVLFNDPGLVEHVDAWLRVAGAEPTEPLRSLGADDFSYYGQIAPSVMAFVGARTAGREEQPQLHHAAFLPEERAVEDVAAALVSGYLGAAQMLLTP